MTAAASPPAAPGPSVATAAGGGGSFLLSAAVGVPVLAACGDLLFAVLLGLRETPVSDAVRWTVRDLGFALGGAALAAFGLAAAALRGSPGALLGAAAGHALVATGLWFGGAAAGPLPRGFLAPVLLHLVSSGLAAAAAAGAGARPAEARAAAGRGAAENLESILVAIVFALAIRHYAVEAYKIPTESMAPTLYGESPVRGPGDRVLVTKAPALLGGPDRWEVWVFRPPLDRTINYVKRVGGLPGETVEIVEGDLVVDGKVARKPPKAREALWFPVWPRPDGAAEAKPPWEGAGFVKEGGAYVVRGATEPRLLEYGPPIQDTVYHGRTGSNVVGDVRLRFRVEAAEPGTEILVRIAGRAGVCEARVDASGNSIRALRDGAPASLSLPPGSMEKTGLLEELEFSFADLRWELRFNGGEPRILDVDDPAAPARRKSGDFGVSFGVAKGGARFTDVRLDRDVFYTGSYRFEVPEGHYLFLGDNSPASQDSRMWAGYEIRETREGGRVFYAADRPRSAGEDGRIAFRDRNGVRRSCAPDEVRISDTRVPLSFVPAEDLHGRAFAIFWPPRWFTKVPGGRLGILP